ncbi:hypothetical protein HMPREF1544_06795 [Mucor circinelloides 1006PhL]|uniref:RING-type domain-containing protein n=1 Tax=Mucor circinelloides f. circinelloides (strain 1006PhL) TaxID=1220926 RepID=S2JUH3_MUCC1|nr:hypothetical protein HMPREF1544_06795 [Mucor circinelloides 1006PhL]
MYNPLACTVCGSEIVDAIPIVNEESSEEEELQEFFSEIDLYYNTLAREQARDDANFSNFNDEEEEDDEEALEERCLFEQLSSMYSHPIARNFTSSSTNPFTAPSRPDTPINTTVYREIAERLGRGAEEAEAEVNEEEEEEDTEEGIISYNVRFEQRTMNELEQPHADRTWETSIVPEPETESLFHLPFARFGRLLDAMYSYRSDDESDEGDSEYHRRSFLDNLADILSNYTSETRQQQTPATPSKTVDTIVKSLQKSCLDSSDPLVHDECIICQEVFGTSIEVFHLPCQHIYHGVCIAKWFNVNTSCPICRHPADKEQQQNQTTQEGRQQQSTTAHLATSVSSSSSTPSLPSTSSFVSAIHEVDRLGWSDIQNVVEEENDPSATESDQSEDVVLDVWRNSDTDQSQDNEHDTDSDDDIVRNFERSISSVLSPRTLNTILNNHTDFRSERRDFHPSLNPMNFNTSSQYQTRSPRNRWYISGVHDDNDDDDDDPMLMDWVYNSSMDEVD